MEKAEEADEGKELARNINNDKEIVENKLNNKEFDIESEEMDELLEWTENLNFDAYVKDWYQLSTS
jgi:CO dehydrogenase nickel-insertion accessory protein CooC1